MTYQNWLDIWLNDYVKTGCKSRTVLNYRQTIYQRIVPYLGEYELHELTLPILQQFVTNLLHPKQGNPLSANTVNCVISVVKSSLKMAHMMGYVENYDLNKLIRPKLSEKKIECFSVAEQKQIVSYIRNNKKIRYYGIVVCLYTGLRIGELLALEWRNVDMNECRLTVEKTCYYNKGQRIEDAPKTLSSLRVIPFPRQLLPLFRAMRRVGKTNYVIETNGMPVSIRSYQLSMELLLNKLKIPHKGFHSLRHTFATRALECGMDVRTLSELLGHADPTVTLKRYAHSMLEYKVEMMNKLGQMFA